MKKGTVIFWSIFAAAAIFRVVQTVGRAPPDASLCLKKSDDGNGVIASDPELTETGQAFDVLAQNITVRTENGEGDSSTDTCARDLTIRVKTKSYPRFSYGDTVTFSGKLSKPFNFSGDGGRTFDYEGYLSKDDIYYEMKGATIRVASSSDLSLLEQVTSFLFRIKHRFVANLDRVLGEPHAALAAGLVVGEKSSLGADLINDFRAVGLIHIVVLSGFNITIVGIALRRLLSRLPRAWGIMIGGIGIALFGVMVGGGATVVRSCFMAGVALIASLIRRDYDVSRALAFAALVMLIQNPLILTNDPSFQLSFLATVGLILLASPIEDRLGFIPDAFGMRGTVASCLATQIFVSPFILYMMGQISLIGVFVNIIVLPFIPATMLFVFIAGGTGFVSYPLSVVAGWGAHLLLQYELFVVTNCARFPYAALQMPAFSAWWVVAFYVIFSTVFICRRFIVQKIARLFAGRSHETEDDRLRQWLSKNSPR